MQIAMAASICSIAGPVVPTGKNRVGSESGTRPEPANLW